MKTKKIIVILLLIINSACIFSQTTSTLNFLMNKNWTMKFISPKETKYSENYSNQIITTKVSYLNETVVITYKFYLSDVVERTFNDTSVGKVPSGKYIITKNNSTGSVDRFEILELTSTYMKLKNLSNNYITEYIVK